jgi:hypothetical protein
MDLSKLNQNEKMAAAAAAIAVVAGLVGFSYSVTILGVLFAVGLLVVIFLPQLSPNTRLPGSKGSLMLVTGGVSALLMVLSLLVSFGIVFVNFQIGDVLFLIAVAAAVAAGWFSWQQFSAEGGKFQLGATGTTSEGTTAAASGSPTVASTEAPRPLEPAPPPPPEPAPAQGEPSAVPPAVPPSEPRAVPPDEPSSVSPERTATPEPTAVDEEEWRRRDV